MSKKVILISIDGMRPDGLLGCGNEYVDILLKDSTSSMTVQTVMPSVTLPCHMTMFHSVDPFRHGTVTNVHMPQVRPVNGLAEQLKLAGKISCSFFTWEELRDLTLPGSLSYANLISLNYTPNPDRLIADAAIEYINAKQPDFCFLYLCDTDNFGHGYGWMGKEYLDGVSTAIDCVKKVRESVPAGYDIIITADHGGHERIHGTELPEDMTIPLIMNGPSFEKGKTIDGVSIKDIAPTIVKLLDAQPAPEWEGKALV